MQEVINTKEYINFLNDIKKDVSVSRVRANLAVNRELILLYWRIGKGILEKQKELGWGAKVIEQLSHDLKHAFPDMKGFGERNLKYMRFFAAEIADFEFVQQAVAQIPWGHIANILDKVKAHEDRVWYIRKTIENGWSRNVLVMHIESQAHLKLGKAQTNFLQTLPKVDSDLAQQIIKSEYNFEFLGLSGDVHERVIEKGLVENVKAFLLELGSGFAFLGSQYRTVLAGEEFFIDLLMYHVKLKSYVVIELKAGKFKPEYLGKLSFYLSAIDREVKDKDDGATIGILLCQSSNKLMVEYCLNDIRKPIGVSEYNTQKQLPKDLEKYLPTPEQFQHLVDTINQDIEGGKNSE